jgi:hypothetical protein
MFGEIGNQKRKRFMNGVGDIKPPSVMPVQGRRKIGNQFKNPTAI